MRELYINAETLYTREDVHTVFAKTFSFPDYYGRNLDALYDLLTTLSETRLTIEHAELLIANLGNYGELLLRVLAGASAENDGFILKTE